MNRNRQLIIQATATHRHCQTYVIQVVKRPHLKWFEITVQNSMVNDMAHMRIIIAVCLDNVPCQPTKFTL